MSFEDALNRVRAERLPVMALRYDDDGLDDVVVKDVETFRAEMMSANELWMCCYFRNGERVTFFVDAKCRPRRLVFEVTETPSDWTDFDALKGGKP